MANVIQIGKRRWLAGMTWASYEDTPDKDELRDDAKRLNSTWSAVRIGEDCIQAGFCSAVDGANVGKLYSLAAMLADSRKQPWLGIFKIEEDLWWYIAVRDGHAILPDGDVLGDRDEIYAAREKHSGYTDWNYVEGDRALLQDLIKDIDESPTRIKSLEGIPLKHKLLVGAGVVALAGSAVGGYWWYQDAKQREEMERMRQQLAKVVPEVKPVASTPATTFPLATALLHACGKAVTLPISQYGWLIDNVSCTVNSATAVWARKDGATVDFRPEGELSADGQKVTQTIDLRLTQQSADDRIPLSEAWDQLLAWSQAAGFTATATVAATDKNASTLPGANPDTAPVPTEKNVTISVNVSPFDLDLSEIPGLRLTAIKMSASGWDLTGVLYGR